MMSRVIAISVIVCVALLPVSILEAEWAPRASTLLLVSALGLASGVLIAPLRWPRAARWPLITLAALSLAVSNAGLLQVSTQVAFTRVTTWATDLQTGRIVQDPNLVAFWVTLLVWWTSYSAAHGVANGGPALNALLPTLIALTVNSIYTGRSLIYTIVALLSLVIAMGWTTQGKRQSQWNERGLDYPDISLESLGSSLLIAAAVCALAWLFPQATSRSTIEWLREIFNPSTSKVRNVAEQMLGGATPIPLPTDIGALHQARSADMPNSHLLGNPPELSRQVVMWVWTDQPPPLPEEVRGYVPEPEIRRPYWRGLAYSTYTGRSWTNPAPTVKPLTSTLPTNLSQRFDIAVSHADTIFAANEPVSGTPGLMALYADGNLIGLRSTLSQYTVTTHLIEADEDTLRQSPKEGEAPISYTTEITPYLQLPDALPRRVRELAIEIAGDATTAYDKATRIEAYLRTYTYTLDLPPVPERRDLVDYFLFDAPGGYCDYYASAMVVMLRVVGVPARLATGYLTGEYDQDRDAYRVLGSNAHSWPEVYFEGIGWVEFEPTASQPIPFRARRAPPVTLSSEQVRAAQAQQQQVNRLIWGVSALVIVASAVVVYWLYRERQLVALPADEAIPLLYQRLRRRGKWLGVTARSSDTPDEFITSFKRAIERAVPTRWHTSAAIAQASAAHIGELYRRASYSPIPPGAHEARQAWAAWHALSWRTWWIGWWGKLKPLPRRARRDTKISS